MQGQPPCSKLCKPSFFSSSWTMASVFSHLERWPAALAAGSELAKTCCTTKRTTLHHVIGIPVSQTFCCTDWKLSKTCLQHAGFENGSGLHPNFESHKVSQGSPTGSPLRQDTWLPSEFILVSMWCELGALFWHWQVRVPTLITGIFLPWWCCTIKPCQQRFCQSICICSIHLIRCPDFE